MRFHDKACQHACARVQMQAMGLAGMPPSQLMLPQLAPGGAQAGETLQALANLSLAPNSSPLPQP